MKLQHNFIQLIWINVIVASLFTGCGKLLNEPSDKSLAIPSSLEDLQALMDRPDKSITGYTPAGEESADDFYLVDADYQGLSTTWDQRRYTWAADDIFANVSSGANPWNGGYFSIYASNAVLDFLPAIKGAESEAGRYIKGQALFWRGFHYFDMAQVWTLPYDANASGSEMGLPLRLDPDFNVPSIRSTLEETYRQIFKDLKEAIPLLITRPTHPVRASRQGAYGVLARAYLAIRDYEKAGLYADSCLMLHSVLLDFNELNASAPFPIGAFNEESITAAMAIGGLVDPNIAKVNPDVYALYQAGDLRKKNFFRSNPDGTHRFKGGFTGSQTLFIGITTGEMLLIRAESNARKGEIQKAMNDLNTLLRSRWDDNVPFVPYTASTTDEAKKLVLEERRKELIMRGLRWMDIRRLNLEGANITQTRTVGGQTYTLPPNDPRYALALPEDLLERSGMPQNRR